MQKLLNDIFDREFKRLQDTGKGPLKQEQDKARFLGLSQSAWSKIRKGKQHLGAAKARYIAEGFRGSEPGAQLLARELLEASQADAANVNLLTSQPCSYQDVEQFFERIGQEGALLCVEYRDYPRADPEGKHKSYARIAARAIARGLNFAMFQPFGTVFEDKDNKYAHHTRMVRSYLFQLKRQVREVHNFMRDLAIEETTLLKKTGDLKEKEKDAIEKRIILYERSGEIPFLGSGIQSRLFYAVIPEKKVVSREVWEWVAAKDNDLFVQRDEDSTPHATIAEQFYPVATYWERHGTLPTDEQMEDAIEQHQDEVDANFFETPWEIFSEQKEKIRSRKESREVQQ